MGKHYTIIEQTCTKIEQIFHKHNANLLKHCANNVHKHAQTNPQNMSKHAQTCVSLLNSYSFT
jgi:hypothetical protein